MREWTISRHKRAETGDPASLLSVTSTSMPVPCQASPSPVSVLVPSMTGVEALTTRSESEQRGHCKVGIKPGAMAAGHWAPGRWPLLGNTRTNSTLRCGLCFSFHGRLQASSVFRTCNRYRHTQYPRFICPFALIPPELEGAIPQFSGLDGTHPVFFRALSLTHPSTPTIPSLAPGYSLSPAFPRIIFHLMHQLR